MTGNYQHSTNTHIITYRSSSAAMSRAERFCLLIICAYYFLPIAAHYIRLLGFLVALTFWLVSVTRRKKLYMSAGFLLLLGSWVVFELLVGIGGTDKISWYESLKHSYTSISFFIPGIVFLNYNKPNGKKAVRFITYASLVFFAVGLVNTYFVLQEYPNASRILASTSAESEFFSRLGAGGFGYIYAIALIIPCLIHIAVEVKRARIAILILSLTSILLVVKSSYTIALFIVCIGVVYALMAKNIWHVCLLTIFTITVLLLLNNYTIGNFLAFMSGCFGDGTMLSRKFLDVSKYFLSGVSGSSLSNRLFVYTDTFLAIKESPVFGALTSGIQGAKHTSWTDLYASYGIFSIFAICVHVFIQKVIFSTVDIKNRFTYGLVLALFWFLGFFNPIHMQPTIGFAVYLLAPALLRTFVRRHDSSEESADNKVQALESY